MPPPDPLPSLDAALRERYRIEREVGRGGMATVYLAHDTRHDRPVALKVLKPELAASLGTDRFLLEIRVTARLQHAHILPLLDSGMLEAARGTPSPFYVMPFVEGESLRDRLRREVQLPVDEALRIAAQVAAALAYAHAHGVIHRDIKPENILLSDGEALVVDFGIAQALSLAGDERLTETGLALGTPHYMSPEQATGSREVDARSDVYALGCVLYEMLAGEPPFTGPTAQAVAAKSLVEPAPPIRKVRPTVAEAVERVIAHALAKVPADRFAGAAEMGDALARAAAAPAPGTTRTRFERSPTAHAHPCGAGAGGRCSRRWRFSGGAIGSTRIIAPAASIAVLPFTPSGADTALSRLGRDLVYTLSAELDGLGGLRVVDAHTVLARVDEGALAAPDPAGLARGFGAASIVQGSLVRVGAAVRLDLALLGADSAVALARATVTAPPESVAVLTDSAARAILVQIWSRGTPPTPSLDAALRTRSVPALRAFLQGEGEITRGEWEAAAVSYQRAMEADPAFWLAYARHLYARYWSLTAPSDSVVALLASHLGELPERERLTTDAILLLGHDSLLRGIEQARTVSRQYPDSWFGWLIYGDQAMHNGPVLGWSRAEARSAIERAITLNPGLIPGWEHLMIDALRDGDTAAAARSLAALDPARRRADSHRRRLWRPAAPVPLPARDPAGRQRARGRARGQRCPRPCAGRHRRRELLRRVSLRVVRRADPGEPAGARSGVAPDRQRVNRLLLALSWGGRGAWDSALVGPGSLSGGRHRLERGAPGLRRGGAGRVARRGRARDGRDPAGGGGHRERRRHRACRGGMARRRGRGGESRPARADGGAGRAPPVRGPGTGGARPLARRARDRAPGCHR